jgi:DNA-binding GntR family transcriptional regulator
LWPVEHPEEDPISTTSARGHRLPQREILTNSVYDALKVIVMNHEIEPGSRVSIDALAADLGVSQTPVREALARLESEGLVVKTPLRGYSTTALLNEIQVAELFDLRLLMEPWASKQAAAAITAAGRKKLLAELAACPEVPSGNSYREFKAFADHDANFHDLLFQLAGNDAIRQAWNHTHCHLHLFRLYYARGLGQQGLEEHHHIAEAVCEGNVEAAEAATVAHLKASRSRLLPAAHP